MQIIISIIVLLLVFSFGVLAWITRKGRKLSDASTKRLQAMITKTNQTADPVLRILEYDKILDQLLYELGFQGSVADKLKKGGVRFSNLQTLWTYHKLRNTIAHEHGATASASDADGFRDAILKALRQVS